MSKSDQNNNAYISAKNEWIERYGSYVKQAQNWRMATFAISIIAGISVVGNIYMGSQSKITPYIVEVDKSGRATAVGPAEKNYQYSEKLIKAQLIGFISDLRLVTFDNVVQKQATARLYSMLPDRKQAFGVVKDMLKNENPFEVSADKSRTIELSSITKVSDQTYQMDWLDIERSVKGEEIAKTKKRAMITFATKKQEDSTDLIKNPLGLYIIELNISNIL